MSDKPKRSWFRFHLLTAVLMVVAAGGLMWLNTRVTNTAELAQSHQEYLEKYPDRLRNGVPNVDWSEIIGSDYGWPATAFVLSGSNRVQSHWIWLGVIADCAAITILLAIVALVSESIVRRREGRKP